MNSFKSSLMEKTFESHGDLVQSTTEALEARFESIDEYLENISEQTLMASEVEIVNEERQSTQRCLEICTRFSKNLTKVRLTSNDDDSSPQWMIAGAYSNFTIIDNCGMGDNAQWMVSTSKKTIRARNRSYGFRNRQVGGDMDDKSAQTVAKSFGYHASRVKSMEDRNLSSRGGTVSVSDNEDNAMANAKKWERRRGPGTRLGNQAASQNHDLQFVKY
jgi:hypothetical protein